MTEFWFLTTCNKPRLRDPTMVSRIVGRYWFDWDLNVEVNLDHEGHPRLVIAGDGWPGAWHRPHDLPAQEFQPDLDTDGVAGFEALLSEIAPHLAEPLIVQSIGTKNGQFPLSACEYQVHPQWQTISKTEFHYPQADHLGASQTINYCAHAA